VKKGYYLKKMYSYLRITDKSIYVIKIGNDFHVVEPTIEDDLKARIINTCIECNLSSTEKVQFLYSEIQTVVNITYIKNLFFRCRSQNTVFSTYPQQNVNLSIDDITFDFYLDPRYKEQILSIENVIRLENKIQEYPFVCLKLSLAFLYANLDSYYQAIMLINTISQTDIETDFQTCLWIHKLKEMYCWLNNMKIVADFNTTSLPHSVAPTIKILSFSEYNSRENTDSSNKIFSLWHHIKTTYNKKDIDEMYNRLCSIETNQVENVFKLSNHSTHIIVRNGIATGAIQSTQNKEYSEKNTIKNILKDTLEASSFLNHFCHSFDTFNNDFIIRLHFLLMRTFRYKKQITNELIPKQKLFLISTNHFRKKNVCIQDRIIFPNYTLVEKLMTKFTSELDTYLSTIKNKNKQKFCVNNYNYDYWEIENVFTISAKIHHILICIHPFEDGNGRLTRLISSIPLIMDVASKM
jgi:hypothetical protein